VLKWIVERIDGSAEGRTTAIGVLPTPEALDLEGLDLPAEDLEVLLSVDPVVWAQEAERLPEYFAQFGEHLPQAITDEHAALVERLRA
jgi:phosphoenolpyruvate carboxykinase (GTP)